MRKAILFDLDGTLVDTLPDIAAIMNAVLAEQGFPIRATEDYRGFLGWGSRELSRRSLPPQARTEMYIAATDAGMRKRYAAEPVRHSRPYPGVTETLQALNGRGFDLAVLSNKPDPLVRLVLERLFPGIPFAVMYGAREGVPHKPDPAAALAIARKLAAEPEDCLFVGDSEVDMQTALNAGMTAVAVSWGYRDAAALRDAGASHILDRPADLLDLLN